MDATSSRPRRIVVTLPAEARERLIELALRELRDPRRQAALLIIEGLEKRAPAGASKP